MSSISAVASEEATSTEAAAAAHRKTVEIQKKDFLSLIQTDEGFEDTARAKYFKRLQDLRDEVNYINETEWMFDPLEKKPSQ